MNELFIQENYLENDVEHVKVQTITSGHLATFEKHEWGVKVGKCEHLYGHVQVKTLLGHVAFEHKGVAVDKNFIRKIKFDLEVTYNDKSRPKRHICYVPKTKTIWVQDYRLVPSTIAAEPFRYIPVVKIYRVVPPGATVVLRKYNTNNHLEDEEMIGLWEDFPHQLEYANSKFRRLELSHIEGTMIEIGTRDNVYIFPAYGLDDIFLYSPTKLDGTQSTDIFIRNRDEYDQEIMLVVDPKCETATIDFNYTDDHTSTYSPTYEELNQGVPIYNSTCEKHLVMLMFHQVEEVKVRIP